MESTTNNPWAVPHVKEFSFLCCPECQFKSKEELSFESHAVSEHPRSHVLFNSTEKKNIKDEAKDFEGDVTEFPAPELTIKETDRPFDPFVKVEQDDAYGDIDYDAYDDYDEKFENFDSEYYPDDDMDEKPKAKKKRAKKRKLKEEDLEGSAEEDWEPSEKTEKSKTAKVILSHSLFNVFLVTIDSSFIVSNSRKLIGGQRNTNAPIAVKSSKSERKCLCIATLTKTFNVTSARKSWKIIQPSRLM